MRKNLFNILMGIDDMKKKLNEKLKERHEELRKDTIEKISNAISDLDDEGYEITTKLLMERTGLSRSVFSKSHVVELLKEKQVGRFKNTKKLQGEDLLQVNLGLQKDIKKYEIEILKLKNDLDKEIQKNMKLELKLGEQEEEILTLRGQLMNIYRKASIKGVDLGN